jgi:hypothetical protein
MGGFPAIFPSPLPSPPTTDVDADGRGVVDEHRLYQVIRESGGISDHTFEIEFFDPGIQAYAFTFG